MKKNIDVILIVSILISSCNFLEGIDKKVGMPRISESIDESVRKNVFLKEYNIKDSILIDNISIGQVWLENVWCYDIDSLGKVFLHKKAKYNLIVEINIKEPCNSLYTLLDSNNHELMRRGNLFNYPMNTISERIKLFIGRKEFSKITTKKEIEFVSK
jgi:hypothetical protein